MKSKSAKGLSCLLAAALVLSSPLSAFAGAYGSPDEVTEIESLAPESAVTATENAALYEEKAKALMDETEEECKNAVDGYEKVSAFVDLAVSEVDAVADEMDIDLEAHKELQLSLDEISLANFSLEDEFDKTIASIEDGSKDATALLNKAIEEYNAAIEKNNASVIELETYAALLQEKIDEFNIKISLTKESVDNTQEKADEAKSLAEAAALRAKEASEEALEASDNARAEAEIVADTELVPETDEALDIQYTKDDILLAIEGLTDEEAVICLESMLEDVLSAGEEYKENYLKLYNDFSMYTWAIEHNEASDYGTAAYETARNAAKARRDFLIGVIIGKPDIRDLYVDTTAIETVLYAEAQEDRIEREYLNWWAKNYTLYNNRWAEILGMPAVTTIIGNKTESAKAVLGEAELATLTAEAMLSKGRAAMYADTAETTYNEFDENREDFEKKYSELISAKERLENIEKDLLDAKTALEKLVFAQKELAGENEELAKRIDTKIESIKKAEAEAERLRAEYENALKAAEEARRRATEEIVETEEVEIPEVEEVPLVNAPPVQDTQVSVEEQIEEAAEEPVVEIVKEEVPLTETPEEVVIQEEAAPLSNFKEDNFGWQWVLGIVVLGTFGAELYRRYIVRKQIASIETFIYDDK